jgi:hypothetical protein
MAGPCRRGHRRQTIHITGVPTGASGRPASGDAARRHAACAAANRRRDALFPVAKIPGLGWGGTDITDPLAIIERIDPKTAWPGMRLLMVSTTGEDAGYFILDESLRPIATEMPEAIQKAVARIGENCEPALTTVMFMAGAGGSLRAGVTENPIRLTRSIKEALVRVTSGGAPVYIWPGGGITYMVDVAAMPDNAFGYVPTPAIVAPIEFTMRLVDYRDLGGHMGSVRAVEEVIDQLQGTGQRIGNG